MLLQVQHRQKRIRIRLVAIHLDGGTECRLRQDQIGQRRHVEIDRVGVEQLTEEVLQTVKVDRRLRIEPLKVDIHHVNVLHVFYLRDQSGSSLDMMAKMYLVRLLSLDAGVGPLHVDVAVFDYLALDHCV